MIFPFVGWKKKIIFYQKRGCQTCPKDVRTTCASVESAIHTSTRLQPLLNLHNLPQTPHHIKILEIKEGLVHHLKFFPFFFLILFAENVGIAQWFRYLTLTHLQQVSIPRLIHPLHVQNHLLPYMCRWFSLLFIQALLILLCAGVWSHLVESKFLWSNYLCCYPKIIPRCRDFNDVKFFLIREFSS